MRIALLQNNSTVGDLDGNARKIADAVRAAARQNAALCVTSELSLLGYPPRDLLLNKGFIETSWTVLRALGRDLADAPPVLVGLAEPNASGQGRPLWNCAALLRDGEIQGVFHKTLLPTYDVFDEDRYFEPFDAPGWFELDGRRIGVTICEDIWNDKDFWTSRRYRVDPVQLLAEQRVHCIVNLSASPFHLEKHGFRLRMLAEMAAKHRLPLVYVNQVGGNDDLIFDGRSCAFDAKGGQTATAAAFTEDLVVVGIEMGTVGSAPRRADRLAVTVGPNLGSIAPAAMAAPTGDGSREEEIWNALVLGVRDYLHKIGFSKALLGLSGGIDSALTAAIAAEALGPENVLAVLLPSPYTSRASIDDAVSLAANLGVKHLTLPIMDLMRGFDTALSQAFAGYEKDVTEENIQARIRGNLLMALSNKYRAMLLTTGNKSELAVGYCTMYGDMAGGLAVIADVPKTLVYATSHWLNARRGPVIPERILTRPPTAELRPNQTDQDSLPEYDVLDAILERVVQLHRSSEEIIREGFAPEDVRRVVGLIKNAEFKRRQAAPGLKITDVAFGSGWRMPIAARWPI
ncbi:NAD+ synthase [Desulfonatronum thiodismutans]|uniref:NAD+ synthase n=1 Tax=Desulfonatronum thiodismutans TaxID=159290 RepID=UPI0004ABDB4C|nr:NAD+ synthase [Desulfonatronum thiodismutans]